MLRASGGAMLRNRSALLLLVRAVHAHAEAAPACAAPPPGVSAYPLIQKWSAGNQSYVLRFALPPEEGALGWRGVKAFLDGEDENTGGPATLEKSYSPVSLPSVERSFDLLVKAYPPRRGGGVGAFLCGLQPGEPAYLKLKPPRVIKGATDIAQLGLRHLGLVGGGTGLAPLLQIVRSLLADKQDTTRISLLCVNRHEADILMRDELDKLSIEHFQRFTLTYALTQPPSDWAGSSGRGDLALAQEALPSPGADTLVLVCGTDGFVDHWAGAIERVYDENGKKKKVQGTVRGVLKAAGFTEDMVYKY